MSFLTFNPEDEAALVFSVGLDVRDEGPHPPVEHGAVCQSHGLHFGQHVYNITCRGHLLQRALDKPQQCL